MPAPLLVATDGSCLKNPGGPTGWAWVAQDGRWHAACDPTGTNQTAELWAVLAALRDFPVDALTIQIDSAYAMKVATTWGPQWARKGWRNASGNVVSNLALVQAIFSQMHRRKADGIPTQFVKVPGHDPHNRWPLNTSADERARSAARYAQRTTKAAQFNQGTII